MLVLKKNHKHTEEIRAFYNNDARSLKAYRWAIEVWSPLNQRTIMGAYSNNPSQERNPQVQSYLAKGIELRMSKLQFHEFVSQNIDTIVGMMEVGEMPSIDRIDPNGHYEIGNIRIITKRENWHRGNIGEHNESRAGDMYTKLKNRSDYITSQLNVYPYKPRHIDYYLKNYPIRFITMVMTNEEILDLFKYIEDGQIMNIAHSATIDAAIKAEKDKYEEAARIDAELKQARVEANIANIQRKKEEAYLKDLKKHPRYEVTYNMVLNRQRALARYKKLNKEPDYKEFDEIISSNLAMKATRMILRFEDDAVKMIKGEN